MSPSQRFLGAPGRRTKPLCAWLTALSLSLGGCTGGSDDAASKGPGSGHGSSSTSPTKPSHGGPPASGRPGGGGRPGGRGGGAADGSQERGVPVEVIAATRRSISQFFETHGALEAEREVDLVTRLAGPIIELKAEEGMKVRAGQLLARIDDREMRSSLAVSEVRLEETKLAYERVKRLFGSELVSQETVDQALANYQSAQGDYEQLKIQLQYSEIKAPFGGLVVLRYVKFAENLSVNQPLFRLSDFDPLLCPIQVPERQLSRLHAGQPAQLQVEAWPGESFAAKVLRISPVVDAETGTIKVTLEIDGQSKLRPGMFASVFLEVETRENALVVPKAALALDALEDTVFVVANGIAERRTLKLGFRNSDSMEVLEGLQEGDQVVVVGQDGLSEGTPLEILGGSTSPGPRGGADSRPRGPTESGSPSRDQATGPDSQRLEEVEQRMRDRGLSEEQIKERLQQIRSGEGGPPGRAQGGGDRPLSPERLEEMKRRMRDRGLSEEQIEERLQQIRQQGEATKS